MKLYVINYRVTGFDYWPENKTCIIDADNESYAVYLFKKHTTKFIIDYSVTELKRNGFSSLLYAS